MREKFEKDIPSDIADFQDIPEGITEFENTMFLVNPIRGMKFAEFISYISKFSWLRVKLIKATKNSSFWAIADAFEQANSANYKDLWESNLPKEINNFLDELEKNQNIKFSRNDIEEIKESLNNVFKLTKKWKITSWIKYKLSNLLK